MDFKQFLQELCRLEPERYRFMIPEQPAGNRPIALFDTVAPCGTFSPLTALALRLKGVRLEYNDSYEAALLIGLSEEDAFRAIGAIGEFSWGMSKDRDAILSSLGRDTCVYAAC